MVRGAGRARARFVCAIAALAMFLGSLSASAQTRTASQAEREGRTEAARAERLREESQAVRREVRDLDARMAEAGRRRAEAEAASAAAGARLALLREPLGDDFARRAHARDVLESAMIAAAFARRRDDPRAVRAGIAARALASVLAARERSVARVAERMRERELAIVEEQRSHGEAAAAIDAERASLAALAAQRRAAEAQLSSEAIAADRRVRALTAEARTLREMAQRAAARARPAAGSPATPPATARARSVSGSTAGPSAIPAAWVAPAEGSVIRGFGARDRAGVPSKGAVLRTHSGAQVVSPAAGRVTYAAAFRSYGHVLILNLDGGYALVLTGLDSVRVRVGDTVLAGQAVGEMAAADTPAPELYVEVRRDRRAVDPGRWLNGRNATAAQRVRAG